MGTASLAAIEGAARNAHYAATKGALVAVIRALAQERLTVLQREFTRMHPVIQGVGLGCGLLLIDVLGPGGVAPFIYFQF